MSLEDKVKAAAKNVEGKLQSAAGEVTGDNSMKLEGEAKQVQASAMNAAADLKDKATNMLDGLKNAVTDAIESTEEKLN